MNIQETSPRLPMVVSFLVSLPTPPTESVVCGISLFFRIQLILPTFFVVVAFFEILAPVGHFLHKF